MDQDRQVGELEFTVIKVVLKTKKFLEGTDKHSSLKGPGVPACLLSLATGLHSPLPFGFCLQEALPDTLLLP